MSRTTGLGAVALVILCFSVRVAAQVNTGTILGSVVDPSGAAIANATVKATNVQTQFSRTTETAADGSYLLPLLPIGPNYTISVEASGFKTYERTGIALQLNQNVRIDVRLEIGQLTQKMEVSAAPPLVDTYSATGGEVVGTERLQELPLNGRNPLQLAGLVTGVTDLQTRPTLNAGNRNGNYMSVNGSRLNETDYQLNGVRFAGSYSNSGLNYPNPDALAEFNLVTNPNSAEYGQYAGAVFTAVIKSGTNDFHGDVFEFLRNDVLNARNFFSSTVPTLRQNQFGATAGGRIIKNRLFWFGAYQGFRIRQQALSASTPLTAGERNGLITSASPVVDPTTGRPFSRGAQGRYIIPASRINPVTATLLSKYIPLPPAGGVLQETASTSVDVDQYSGKIDYRISDRNQLYVSGLDDLTKPNNPFMMGSFSTYGSIAQTQLVRVISASDIHSFKPNVINEFRFGFSEQEEQYQGIDQISPADLGIQNWNYNYLTDTHPQSPTFSVAGRFTLGSSGFGKWREGGQNFQYTDMLRWVSGNHSITTGVDFYHREHHLDANVADTGDFAFSGLVTGNTTADFLLGKPSDDVRVRYLNHPGYKAWTSAFFFEDNWKVHPRLTMNLGLRYELYYPFEEYRAQGEANDQWEQHGVLPLPGEANFEAGVQSQVLPLAPPGLVYVGDKTPDFPNGIPKGIIRLDKLQIQPRLGMAWDPFGDGKTSVRASAGLFSNAQYVDMQAQNSQDLPWVVVQVPVLPPGDLTNPYQGLTPFPPPTSQSLKTDPNFFTPFLPATAYGWSPDYVMPRILSTTFDVQRQLTSNFMIDAGYDGKFSRHLQVGTNINTAVYIPGQSTISNEQARRPYDPSAYQAIYMQESVGNASYNALQVTARYRYSNGLSILSSYTWAHAIDFCSQYAAGGSCFQDPNNMRGNRASSDFDQRHVYALSIIYDVPDYFKNRNHLVSHILGGWEVSGIVSAHTGLPFTVVTGTDASLTGAGNDRPDLIGNPYLSGQSEGGEITHYFNNQAFGVNTGHFGNLGRNTFTSPAFFNSDLALMKNIPFGEVRRIQFRAEFFNAFNQTHLSAPNTTLISPAFGQITSAGDPRLVQLGLKFLW